jgi:hypothetical protein
LNNADNGRSVRKVTFVALTSFGLLGTAVAATALSSQGSSTSTANPLKTTTALVTIPVIATSLAVSSSSTSTSTAKAQPQAATAPASVPATTLGVNLNIPVYYGTQRIFSNLAAGSNWKLGTINGGWGTMAPGQVNGQGVVTSLKSSEMAVRYLTAPAAVLQGTSVQIKCTYLGNGSINAYPTNSSVTRSGNSISFIWQGEKNRDPLNNPKSVMIKITKTDPANPVHKVDCREASASPNDLYDPAFIQSLAPFKVIRFMDWMNTNANKPVTWATRTLGTSDLYSGDDGVSIENMVALANKAGKDPWFSLPWNADDDYYRRFATYVRDNLAPGRKAYVELSNEVWNWSFPVATQAAKEGMAEGLSTNKGYAQLYRYSEKTAKVMKIWTDVFAGQTNRIVRVAGTQAAASPSADKVLSFGDTAKYVDAIAIAPYFIGGDLASLGATSSNLDSWFATAVPPIMTRTIGWIDANRAVTRKYGKRLICYETGQHFRTANNDVALLAKVNRHPRMGDNYTQFLTTWQKNYGDTVVLYNNVGKITKFGAWGLQEYEGQPLSQSPKMNAVMNFSKKL